MSDGLQRAADALHKAKCIIAVTGAGASAESGIPTFRDIGGLWERFPPDEYATLEGYLRDPHKVWEFWLELGKLTKDCKPNPGHYALAELEAIGRLEAVITQNIDNLHQDAGSKTVIEFHGNTRRMRSVENDYTIPLDPQNLPATPPRCPLGTLMKPDVVMFGEMIPVEALLRSEKLATEADAVIIVGTSAQVFPAAQIPYTAKENGAFVIECNIEKTDFLHDGVTDVLLEGKCGETLPALVEALKNWGQ